MNKFLNNSINEISEVIILTSKKLKIPEVIVEKDIWVSYILEFLFKKSKYKDYFQFKGGTSLSKAYNVINRFSEDIDIVLNHDAIGVNLLDLEDKTKSGRRKFINQINELALEFYEDKLIPELRNYFENSINHKLIIRLEKAELAIYVHYPSVYDDEYVRNEVKIEIGPISAWNPNDKKILDSFVYGLYPKLFHNGTYEVLVTDINRTFVEKLFILHKESNRTEKFPLRFSRHYYDVYKIYKSYYNGTLEIEDKLIDEVRIFHELFYYRKWANFETGKKGTFNLLPNDEYLLVLQKDYTNMLEMIYKEDTDIKFSQIIDSIKEIEISLNKSQ